MHRQRRLAHAPDAGQRRHGHHPALRRRQHLAQLRDEGGAAGEVGDRGGELRRADRDDRGFGERCRRFREARVRLEDALLQLPQARTGVDAQLVRQQAPRVRVHRQRLRLAPAAVQREHQQLAQAFPQGVRRGERRQFRDRLRVAALLQVHVQAGLQELEPPFLQADALRLGVGAGHARQGLTVPQGQHPVQHVPGMAQIPGPARLLRLRRQLLGDRQVQRAAAEAPDRVAAGLAHQDARVQDLAQPGRVRPQRCQRLRRWLLAPQRVDQLGRRRRTALSQQQGREQGALLRGAGVERFLPAPGAHRAEHAEAQRRRLR